MKRPAFWDRPDSRTGRALAPLGWLYYALGRIRWLIRRPERIDVPVICIGNLEVGGSGKTPTAIALAELLAEKGIEAHFLSRGYGGLEKGPHLVQSERDSSRRVGDEPLLLASYAPCWVARDRSRGAQAARRAGAEAIIMDDGFQNPGLHKDFSLIVMDGKWGFGNGHLIPAGPLREPVKAGLRRADASLSIGPKSSPALSGLPHFIGKVRPIFSGISLTGTPVLAFAGIGRPQKFFDTLQSMGARLVDTESFPDHARYNSVILHRLRERADRQGLELVCTEKDAVKFPPDFRGQAIPVPIKLHIEERDKLWRLLEPIFEGRHTSEKAKS